MKAFYENRTYSSEIPVSAGVSNDLDFMAHYPEAYHRNRLRNRILQHQNV